MLHHDHSRGSSWHNAPKETKEKHVKHCLGSQQQCRQSLSESVSKSGPGRAKCLRVLCGQANVCKHSSRKLHQRPTVVKTVSIKYLGVLSQHIISTTACVLLDMWKQLCKHVEWPSAALPHCMQPLQAGITLVKQVPLTQGIHISSC